MDVISLGFRTDLRLRALEGGEVVDHRGYVTVRSPAQPDFWWGNFLLLPAAAAYGEAEPWLSLFRAEFPAAGHVALGLDGIGGPAADLGSFTAAGLVPQRETVLTTATPREPPNPCWDAVIRPLAGDGDWQQATRLQIACDAADGGPAGPAFVEARYAVRRRLTEAGQGAWFGAFRAGELLAQLGVFATAGGLARYQDVATHPSARRQGLAGTLVWRAGQYAIDRLGASTLVIVADPGEGAIRVYRGTGFADRETQVSMERAPHS
ncbi:MAG: GNAT family N-acetyltransferase [Streptosporangiaceae bacterium]